MQSPRRTFIASYIGVNIGCIHSRKKHLADGISTRRTYFDGSMNVLLFRHPASNDDKSNLKMLLQLRSYLRCNRSPPNFTSKVMSTVTDSFNAAPMATTSSPWPMMIVGESKDLFAFFRLDSPMLVTVPSNDTKVGRVYQQIKLVVSPLLTLVYDQYRPVSARDGFIISC